MFILFSLRFELSALSLEPLFAFDSKLNVGRSFYHLPRHSRPACQAIASLSIILYCHSYLMKELALAEEVSDGWIGNPFVFPFAPCPMRPALLFVHRWKFILLINVSAPSTCPHCLNEHLRPYAGLYEHVQEDIVIEPKTVVVNYLHEQSFCPKCDRSVIQAGEGEILNAHIGPVAKSVAIYLRYRIGISYRKTTSVTVMRLTMA